MCENIKNMDTMQKRYNKAVENNIEIMEIEFSSGRLEYRDRWSVKKLLDQHEESKNNLDRFIAERNLKDGVK